MKFNIILASFLILSFSSSAFAVIGGTCDFRDGGPKGKILDTAPDGTPSNGEPDNKGRVHCKRCNETGCFASWGYPSIARETLDNSINEFEYLEVEPMEHVIEERIEAEF